MQLVLVVLTTKLESACVMKSCATLALVPPVLPTVIR